MIKNILLIILSGLLLCVSIISLDIYNKSESQHGYITEQQDTIKDLNKQLLEKELNNEN